MKISKDQLCDHCLRVSANTSDGHSFTIERLLESSSYNNGNRVMIHGGNIRVKEILEADGNCPTGECVPLFAAAIAKGP